MLIRWWSYSIQDRELFRSLQQRTFKKYRVSWNFLGFDVSGIKKTYVCKISPWKMKHVYRFIDYDWQSNIFCGVNMKLFSTFIKYFNSCIFSNMSLYEHPRHYSRLLRVFRIPHNITVTIVQLSNTVAELSAMCGASLHLTWSIQLQRPQPVTGWCSDILA
jgi:hypothetical protein